ncbi:MAG: glycosyltransferase family 4 protein [Eubacteriales bacterium]
MVGLRGIPDIQGGIEKHCQELYPILAGLGFHVTILARDPYTQNFAYDYKGVCVRPIWAPRKQNLEAITHTLYALIKIRFFSHKYDIVHIHGIGPGLLTGLAKLFGFKVVVTNHGPDYDRAKWGRIAKSVLRLGEKVSSLFADYIVSVSRNICANLEKNYHRDAIYIPNGIHVINPVPPGPILKRLSLKRRKYILAVGRLVPEKGFHDLIEAYKRIDTLGWQLVIAGDADHKSQYSRNLLSKAEKTSGVVMAGFCNRETLNELYSNAGLFVLPSYHEGLPLVGLEALSFQVRCLFSDIPANKEIAMPFELFSPGDVEDLSDKIRDIISNPMIFNKPINDNNRCHRINTEFKWDNIAIQTAKVYLSLL